MKQCTKSSAKERHVLLVTPQPFFEERGTPIAISYVLKALSELGYTTDLVAFPIGREMKIPGLRIHRVRNILGIATVPIGFSLRKLFLDFFLYFKVRQLLKKNQYSYIHAVEEAAFIAAIASKKTNIPILYDMASSLPEQLESHPLIGSHYFLKLAKKLEAWLIRRVNYVVCSGGLQAHVQSIKQDDNVSEWWFPSVVTDGVHFATAKQYRKELQLDPEQRLFVYTGSFSSYQGIDILLNAISLVEKNGVSAHFLLAGATPDELSAIREQWKSAYPGNVTVLGRVTREEVGKMLLSSDILISPRLYGKNIPLKIFDYMGAGKPIIASNIPAHLAVLDESRAVFFENTPESLASAITNLIQDQDKAASLSENSLVYAKEFLTWDLFRSSLKKMIESLPEQNNNV